MEDLLQLAVILGRMSIVSLGGFNTVLGDLQRDVVGQGWMSSSQFAEAFALSQLTPGPSATFVVIPIGYAAAGLGGVVVALAVSTLPSALLALAVSGAWARVREARWAQAVRLSLGPLAIGLILASTFAVGREVVQDAPSVLLALISTVVLFRTSIPMPLILFAAGGFGALFLQP